MPLLEKLREPLSAIRPMRAVFDQEYVRRIDGPNKKPKASKRDHAEMLMEDMRQFRERTGRRAPGHDLVRFDRSFPQARQGAPDAAGL